MKITFNDYLICFNLGLVDTAVKTAETGYMQRRLVKVKLRFTKRLRTENELIENQYRWCDQPGLILEAHSQYD